MAKLTGMIQRVDASELYHMACRMDRGEQFGYNGWRAIGEYLESLSDDIEEPIEADVVGICCDYSKADSAEEWWQDYGKHSTIAPEEWGNADDDAKLELIRDYLEYNTSVVCCEDDCIIWMAF